MTKSHLSLKCKRCKVEKSCSELQEQHLAHRKPKLATRQSKLSVTPANLSHRLLAVL